MELYRLLHIYGIHSRNAFVRSAPSRSKGDAVGFSVPVWRHVADDE